MDPDDINESDQVLPDEEDLQGSEVLGVDADDDSVTDKTDDDEDGEEKVLEGFATDKDDTNYNPADY